MNKPFTILISLFLLSVIALMTGACHRNRNVRHELDRAESLMNSAPDSALALLDSIPAADVRGRETAARYALLKSIALDKNYIDTTTFDVLQPAIDYYLTDGTPDEQLRTYYYQGRIYQNRGDLDSSMIAYLKGLDKAKVGITDSLLLAKLLVAQGALYIMQYNAADFVRNSIQAGKIYEHLGKPSLALKSYCNALGGNLVLNNKAAADSLMGICTKLNEQFPGNESYTFAPFLIYAIDFGSDEELRQLLAQLDEQNIPPANLLDVILGYSKIGDYPKAIALLEKEKLFSELSPMDSLRYHLLTADIYESQGNYKDALKAYKEYCLAFENSQNEFFANNVMFASEKHELEKENLKKIQKKNEQIYFTLICIIILIAIIGWGKYSIRLSHNKRIIVEKDNEKLRLTQEILIKDKENAELERDKRILAAENLEKEKKRLEAEQNQRELEAINLRYEKTRLEEERDNLKDLLKEQTELAQPIKGIIKERLSILNSLLAKEITQNDSYAKPYKQWIESIRKDKEAFMNSTRLAFSMSQPNLMKYLNNHGLSIDEINYLCLYALGLRGKEVGEYMQLKRHYSISSEIRKKLGIDEHETNIGLYIRRKMVELDEI